MRRIGQRADLVKRRRGAVAEELFERVEALSGGRREQPEAERLRNRRCRAVEHRVGAVDVDPGRAGAGGHAGPRVDEGRARLRLGAFKPARERKI